MERLLLEQASIWGRVFEIAVQRGVLQQLIHQKLLLEDNPLLEPWHAVKIADVYHQLVKALDLTDANAKEWAGSTLRHLLVLGYGLGWSVMREYLKHTAIRKAKLEALWCPLTLPGMEEQRAQEIEKTALAFQMAFKLPHLDLGLVRQGQPARADFLLWLSSDRPNSNRQKPKDFILCLEFSYNAPAKLADFKTEAPHRDEINRYARYIDSRGVFSRICAEVTGEEFLLSSNLANHLAAFSSSDKPLFKLCQASSYTERLVHLLQTHGKLQYGCNARAIAVTSNGFESLAAHLTGQTIEPDPRAKLMKSLGEAYQTFRKPSEDNPNELNDEIRLVFNKLVRSLPPGFKQQAKQLSQLPKLGERIHFLFKEDVEGFYNPAQTLPCDEAISLIEETPELTEFFGGSPKSRILEAMERPSQQNEPISLRQIHAAAVVAGLQAAQTDRLNVIALEGNPGIGKTTAVTQFLKQQPEGYLFLYVSPRVVINRDVTAKLAQEQGQPSGILTLITNANLIASAPQWYEQQVIQQGRETRRIDSAVVVDGIKELQRPLCNTIFVTPEQEHEIDHNAISSRRYKQSRSEREDSMEPYRSPGVLRTLAGAARRLLEANPTVNRLVMTAAIQGYRALNQKTTIDALSHLFVKKADTKLGRTERLAFSKRIPTIIAMVDELAGDGAGAPFVHRLADWLHQQFIEPFEGTQVPFKVILIISDASLSNEIVLGSFLNSGERAPGKVLISPSQGTAPFRVTGNYTKVGTKKHPTLHVMTNSYPASTLKIDYSIRLSPITPGLTSAGKKQTARQAIREQADEELLLNAEQEIHRGLASQAEQIIFFAQDKLFLRELQKKLTSGTQAPLSPDQVDVLDQSVVTHKRLELVQEPRRDKVRVFLMTSSGARGVSFPKTDWIIAWIPRFSIESALMEIAQLIYRGRGMYTDPEQGIQVSGDQKARQLVMLINDFIVNDEEIDQSRLWLRQSSDLLTLLVMLRSTIHTRIKGDAGLKRQRIAFVPVGVVGDTGLLSLMSDDVREFLQEAQVFILDEHSADTKAVVRKAEQLTMKVFAQFDLTGHTSTQNAKSYVDYKTLEALAKAVSRSSSRLLPSLENEALIIPEYLTCVGPFWMEDWSDRKAEERFSFEGWRTDIQESSSQLLGLLKQIFERAEFPPKLKRPAKELYRLLIREKEESSKEYSTLQEMKTESIIISVPLDYPHFWHEQLEEDGMRQQMLEDPEIWRSALGRSLASQGSVMPVISKYRAFPWAAVAGRSISAQLETIFDDRYFMASSELNLLNTILLEDEEG